jgi:guanylate kinase
LARQFVERQRKRLTPLANPVMPEVDRHAASRAAVAARRARAAIKSSVAWGEREPLDVLAVAFADPQSAEATLRVTDFMAALPSIGPTKMFPALEHMGISVKKRLGGLGKHQQKRLHNFVVVYQGRRRIEPKPRLIVLAGPAGVGKGTVAAAITQQYPDVHLSISATTRSPRPGEADGVNYYFVEEDEFDALVNSDQLLEWATVHKKNRYGTPRQPVEHALGQGRAVLLEIDIQGARQVKLAMPDARLVFLLPPSWDELVRRLVSRGTETEEDRARRLETATIELAAQHEFDVRIVNDDVSKVAQQVVDLMGINKELSL